MKHKYTPWIEEQSQYWGPEFAGLLGLEYKPEYDELIAMACYTMLSEIAASWQNGKHFDDIMTQWTDKLSS